MSATGKLRWLNDCTCGAQTLPARAPSGRHVELEANTVTVADGGEWPDGRLFTVIHKPDDRHPEPYYARPVSELMDRRHGAESGPFHYPHVCRT